MRVLVVIPARGGSKGIPHKNIKLLNGKPLIIFTQLMLPEKLSLMKISVFLLMIQKLSSVENYGLKVPFVRPAELASDTAGTYEVLLHALDFYESKGRKYDVVLLLQNTSPFRNSCHVKEALSLYKSEIDMVVSVKEASSNPYYNCFEEDENGFLHISKGDGHYTRRQDVPKTFEYNGAIYVINPVSLKENPLGRFKKIVKYVMDDLCSVDLDNMIDWKFAEYIIKEDLL